MQIEGRSRRLPLCEASAAAIVSALLEPSVERGRETLECALARDPGLALWISSRSSGLSTTSHAEWLIIHAANELVWPPPESPDDVINANDVDAAAEFAASQSTRTPAQVLACWRETDSRASLLAPLLEKLRHLENLQRDFQTKLEQEKLASLAEFAAGAGHEMNNPLAVISGRAQLLLQSERDPERRRDLAVMHVQAMRVHEMIADLMLFARPPQPRLASVDLAELLPRICRELQPKAAGQETWLRADVPEDLPPVLADAVQLAVAVRALCENSLQSLHRGGNIVVAVRRSEGDSSQLAISVRDDGPGIPPEVRRHLFDPFFSGRNAGRGLGNGLAKCWRIVTNHGGSIDVASEPGGPTVFTLNLPVAPTASATLST